MKRNYIRQVGGRLLGYVEEDSSGNKIVYSASGKMEGKYSKNSDTTYDFYGHIIAFGDVAAGILLVTNNVKI